MLSQTQLVVRTWLFCVSSTWRPSEAVACSGRSLGHRLYTARFPGGLPPLPAAAPGVLLHDGCSQHIEMIHMCLLPRHKLSPHRGSISVCGIEYRAWIRLLGLLGKGTTDQAA